jgi:uncharacterized oxidoreductase
MRLSQRTVLITGGSSGIGLGLAEAFDREGSRVIVCGRDPEKLKKAGDRIPGLAAISCDVGAAAWRRKLAEEVLRRFPALDILVNNAGIQYYVDLKLGPCPTEAGDEIEINLRAPIELVGLFLPHLMARPEAAVVNISSGLGFMPMSSTAIYNATKAALHTYTLALRQQLEGSSVRVIEVVPPMVDTGLNQAGRERARMKFRGISVAEYVPTVMEGLRRDEETIFYGGGGDVLTLPRGETEKKLLAPRRLQSPSS